MAKEKRVKKEELKVLFDSEVRKPFCIEMQKHGVSVPNSKAAHEGEWEDAWAMYNGKPKKKKKDKDEEDVEDEGKDKG